MTRWPPNAGGCRGWPWSGRECARPCGDQRVHRNPVTLVTLTVRYPGAKLARDQQRAIGSDGGRASVRRPRSSSNSEVATQAYAFEGPTGTASLLDLFEGRRQLIIYRAFFEPGVFGWPEHACRGCSLGADQVAHLAHLNVRDTNPQGREAGGTASTGADQIQTGYQSQDREGARCDYPAVSARDRRRGDRVRA